MDKINTEHVLLTNHKSVMPANIRILSELSYYRVPMSELVYWYSMNLNCKIKSSKSIHLLSIF